MSYGIMTNPWLVSFLMMYVVFSHLVGEGECGVGGQTRPSSIPQPVGSKRLGPASRRNSEDETGTTKSRAPKYFLFQDSNGPHDENLKVLTEPPSTSSTMRSYRQISSTGLSMYSDATHFHVLLLAEKHVLLQGTISESLEHEANKLEFTEQEIQEILKVTYFSRKQISSLFNNYKVLQSREIANKDAQSRLEVLVAERQKEWEIFNHEIEGLKETERRFKKQTEELLIQVGDLRAQLDSERTDHSKVVMSHVKTNDELSAAHQIVEQDHQKTVREMAARHEELEADKTRLASQLEELNNEASTKHHGHEAAIAEHTATIAKLEREKALAEAAAKDLEEMKTHLKEMKDTLKPFYEERSAFAKEVQALSDELDGVFANIKRWLEHFQVNAAQFQVVPKENQDKIKHVNAGIDQLANEIQKARNAEEELKVIMGTTAEQQKIYLDRVREREMAEKRSEIETLQAQMNRLKGKDPPAKLTAPSRSLSGLWKMSRVQTMVPQDPPSKDSQRSTMIAPEALKTGEPAVLTAAGV